MGGKALKECAKKGRQVFQGRQNSQELKSGHTKTVVLNLQGSLQPMLRAGASTTVAGSAATILGALSYWEACGRMLSSSWHFPAARPVCVVCTAVQIGCGHCHVRAVHSKSGKNVEMSQRMLSGCHAWCGTHTAHAWVHRHAQ